MSWFSKVGKSLRAGVSALDPTKHESLKDRGKDLGHAAATLATGGLVDESHVAQAVRWEDPTTKAGRQHLAVTAVAAAAVVATVATAGAAGGALAAVAAGVSGAAGVAGKLGAVDNAEKQKKAAQVAEAQAAAAKANEFPSFPAWLKAKLFG